MAKGGEFEREISKYLTEWLTCKKKPYAFWRQDASGGLGTICEENSIHSGDIKATLPEAFFMTDFWSIECKSGYPKASFWHLFKRVKGFDLKDFWEQACRDALRSKKYPMLIYRKKGKSPIVGITETNKQNLEKLYKELKTFCCLTMRFDFAELPNVTFYGLEDFFSFIDPIKMRKYIENEIQKVHKRK